MSQHEASLVRAISLPMLVLYGLGTTIGAGIYVVIGATAEQAGAYLPVAFLLASLIAAFSALSFAELATRFPVSAGEAAYIEAGLGIRQLSLITALFIGLSGAVSSATLLQGGAGYLHALTGAPKTLIFLVLLAAVGALVSWGIAKSMVVAAAFTIAEIVGLAAVIALAPADPVSLAATAIAQAPPLDATVAAGISTAILLAFFAFIGFEDMVNVIEEVREPHTTMPRAIILTLVITTALYIWISLIAVTVLTSQELGNSDAPLALLFSKLAGGGDGFLTAIAIAAVVNGAIIQFVMVSRVLYGISRMGHIPAEIGAVSATTHTPIRATIIVGVAVLIIGMLFDLTALAATTSSFTLAAFALVNVALVRIKLRGDPHAGFKVPIAVPLLGCLTAAGLLAFETGREVLRWLA